MFLLPCSLVHSSAAFNHVEETTGVTAVMGNASSVKWQYLSCDESPLWLAIKTKFNDLVAWLAPHVANDTFFASGHWASRVKQVTQKYYYKMRRDHMPTCALGSLGIKIFTIILDSERRGFDRDFMEGQLSELDIFRYGSVMDIVRSGWRLFGLVEFYLSMVFPKHYGRPGCYLCIQGFIATVDSGCRSFETHANTHDLEHRGSILTPVRYGEFLRKHLMARKERLLFSCSEVKSHVRHFRRFALHSDQYCGIAVAVGFLAEALGAIGTCDHKENLRVLPRVYPARIESQSESTDEKLRMGSEQTAHEKRKARTTKLIQRSEWHFLRAWKNLDGSGYQAGIACVNQPLHVCRMRALLVYPFFLMMQTLQDLMGFETHHKQGTIAYGIDEVSLPLGVDRNWGSFRNGEALNLDFWHHRRKTLRNHVLGLHQASERANAVIDGGQLLITWNFSRLSSTAVLTRPANQSPKGLVIHHTGHEGIHYDLELGSRDPHGTASYLAELGFDVLTLCMPLMGYNKKNNVDGENAHDIFIAWEEEKRESEALLSYFIGPVVLAIDWARDALGHDRFAMVGCSGGSWTTHFAAALDQRISLSIAIHSNLPSHLIDEVDWRHYDWEAKSNPRHVDAACSTFCKFILTALDDSGAKREAVHILHEWSGKPDPASHEAFGMEAELNDYYILVNELVSNVSTSAGFPASDNPALRLWITGASQHCGDRLDHDILNATLLRWRSLKNVFLNQVLMSRDVF